jgi:hypothetical protein
MGQEMGRMPRPTAPIAVGLALLALACTKDPAADTVSPPSPAPATATDDAATAAPTAPRPQPPADAEPPPSATCAPALDGLAGLIARMHKARDGRPYYDRAARAWAAVDADCRGARWHLAAAQLLRWDPAPIDAGGAKVSSPAAALTAALAAEPNADVLVLTAFVSGLGGQPALPDDACARATAAAGSADDPRARYVCGHAVRGTADAVALFARVDARLYPDAALRLAEALAAAGKTDRARARAEQAAALDPMIARNFGATDRERGAIVAAAKTLLGKL